MPKIIFVTHIAPRTMSSGGEHRSYQIQRDLWNAVGADSVELYDPRPAPSTPKSSPIRIPWRLKYLARRISYFPENPYRSLLLDTHFSMQKYAFPGAYERYEAALKRFQPTHCVIQHAACTWMAEVNRRNGVLTIACPQNLDAIDQGMPLQAQGYLPAVLQDLAAELGGLRACDDRLMISKVETAIVEGVGYSARFYPYRPMGEIRDFLSKIRHQRAAQPQDKGVFLMLGSASHEPIREGMLWFLDQVEKHGLPPSVTVVAAGNGTDKLLPAGKILPGVRLMGLVDQATLEHLLLTVQGVLLPKYRGFGSVTRLPEMSCAGIPTIASEHLLYAIDAPPNVLKVDRQWSSWATAMQALMDSPVPNGDEYDEWHARQISSLENVIHETEN